MKFNDNPFVKNQTQYIRLNANRTRAVFRTLLFALVFGILAASLLHALKEWGTKPSFFDVILPFMACLLLGCVTFLSASKSLFPQYIDITTQYISIKYQKIERKCSWSDIGSPRIIVGNKVNHYITFDNENIFLQPEEFQCREAELLGIINAARAGHLIDLPQWRNEHPLQRWMQIFMGLTVFLAMLLWKFGTTFWHHG